MCQYRKKRLFLNLPKHLKELHIRFSALKDPQLFFNKEPNVFGVDDDGCSGK